MIFSRACEYGIQALVYLFSRSDCEFVPVKTLAEERDIPVSFLAKILRILVRSGLLESVKGPGGGVRPTRRASEITLYEIVAAIDGTESIHACVLGLPRCGDDAPCPLHPTWTPVRQQIVDLLSSKSFEGLVHDMHAHDVGQLVKARRNSSAPTAENRERRR